MPAEAIQNIENEPDDSVPQINGDMLIIKENSLARSAMELSLAEHRLVNVLSSLITPEDRAGKKYRFRIQDYCSFFGIDERGNHTQLKKVFISLRKKVFVINRNGVTHITGWINTATIIHGAGIVEITIDERILPFLLYIKNNTTLGINPNIGYIKHPLTAVKYFTSEYSYNFYTYLKTCIQDKKYIKLYFSIDDLKKILIVKPEKYSQFTGLKTRVLMPAVAEINGDMELLVKYKAKKKLADLSVTPTDIRIGFTEAKKGKKVEGIHLEIWKNTAIGRVVVVDDKQETQKELKAIGYSAKEINSIFNVCAADSIEKDVYIANARYAFKEYARRKGGVNPVKNLVAYTIACIKSNLAASEENSDEEEKPKPIPLFSDSPRPDEIEKIDFWEAFNEAELRLYLEEYASRNNRGLDRLYKVLKGKMSLEKLKLCSYLLQRKNGK